MTILEIIGTVLGVLACTAGMVCLPILLCSFIDKIIENYRRNKHPEYFEYWDTAVSESFRIGKKLNAEKSRIEYYIKLYTVGYRDGECTAEDITKKMAQVTQWWISACDEYNQEYLEIKDLLNKADTYAKEHNLKWGIIYET